MQRQLNFSINSEPSILDGLNKEQTKAVSHKNGPLLIIAGAGTGKTTVITRRIAHIIEQKWAHPSEILALTFTEKAAAEMEERVDKLVPYGFTDMWISTFHAFGDRLLRDYSIDLGLPSNFKVLTATEQAVFMRQNLFAFDLNYYRPLSNPVSHIEALLKHFSRLKDELIEPEDYLKFAENQISKLSGNHNPHPNPLPHLNAGEGEQADGLIEAAKTLELAQAYLRYNELMIQNGNLDFGDQIFLTYRLLKEHKKVLDDCQKKFKYILVDEFQDTNFAQNEIVKLLAGERGNITVVGDDDQSIYRFRGASISNILQFEKTYKNITRVVLNMNYRSTQEILDSSYKLIQHNNPDRLEYQNKINKRLVSSKAGRPPQLLYCDTLSREADLVVQKIVQLKKKKGYKNNDFALLVRANNQAEPFIQSLNMAGIPYTFSGASDLFSRPEIRMLVAFLKCLVYSDDNISFHQLATSEIYNIGPEEMAPYYTAAKRQNRAIIGTIETELKQKELIGRNQALAEIVSDIHAYQKKMQTQNTGEILYDFLSQNDCLKKLSQNPTVEEELKIQNIAKFFDRIAEFNRSSQDKSILAFLNNLELLLEFGGDIITSDINPDIEAVNILTAHAGKGLEWPVVFVVNLVADRFPSRKKRDAIEIPNELIKERLPEGDFHLQEERRLFYVACTRAKEKLFLTAARDYGGKRSKKLSQFVMELLDEPNPEQLKHAPSPLEKIERFKKVEKEINHKIKKLIDGKIRLSRQQIDDYFTCPKKYYFAHIIRIPLLENHQLMYGTAVHAALDYYFQRKISGEKIALDQLLADFRQAFHSVGFITREHEDKRFQAGIGALTKFYKEDQKNGSIPNRVESAFVFSTGDVIVNGRFDLIYGTGKSSEIRDFKTSNVAGQKEADRRIKESTQMKIYALAWFEKNRVIPKTTLYFIESGLMGERIFAEKELEEAKRMIETVAAGIKKDDTTAKPDRFSCQYCPYKTICSEALLR